MVAGEEVLQSSVTALDIRRVAMGLLARRDYSRQELRDKLLRRFSGFIPASADGSLSSSSCIPPNDSLQLADLIEQELAGLQSDNLQSDERFLESFINGRKAKGHGPYKIRQALHGKGIADSLLQRYLDDSDEGWLTLAYKVYQKKYGKSFSTDFNASNDIQREDFQALDFKEKARRMRFLQQRGFPSWVMDALF